MQLHSLYSYMQSLLYLTEFIKYKKIGYKKGERSDIYLTQVCRLSQNIESLKRIDKKVGAFSQHSAFHRLQKQTDHKVSRYRQGVMGRILGVSWVRLTDVNTGRISGLTYKLVCCFKLAADLVRGGIRKFLYDADRLAFLKRHWWHLVLIGNGRSEFRIVHLDRCPFMILNATPSTLYTYSMMPPSLLPV